MNSDKTITAFWNAYLYALPKLKRPKRFSAWPFGDSPQMANKLGGLVKAGIKTATCSPLWAYEETEKSLPEVGEYSVILDGDGQPICIIETTEVILRTFSEVDAQFAHDEGEGDRSLESWREAHWHFFSQLLANLDQKPDIDMPIVCERFRVVYPQRLRFPDANA
jgi:uncharacterized protein YhfF